MEMLNRLKSTVTGALPGNPITREFEIGVHCASGGPSLLWKIHNGVKKTTKQEVSVFIFDKKQLDGFSRHDRELILDVLKKGVSQLTRLRHPKILSVLHPLEESRESLAFATEPVLASLANILGHQHNLPNPVPPQLETHKLYDVEIKYGLLQVVEALSFLHNDAKLVHSNLCPESVIINRNGAWKIAGFDFCIHNKNEQDQAPYFPFREWSVNIPPMAQPPLNYLAPETVLSMSCDTNSDIFSLGVLFYAIFHNGRALYDCQAQLNIFRKNVVMLKQMKLTTLSQLPNEARENVKLMLNWEPTVRPDSQQLTKISFFDDVGAMTLQYLDSLFQQDNLQKSQFFKGLAKILQKMPIRVGLQRVLPCLEKECINPSMIPFVLPNILLIAQQASAKEFTAHILPMLKPLFKIQEPVQVTLIFLQNMNLLLNKTPPSDICDHVLPMIYRALEGDAPQIQELCLNIIPTFANLIDYTSMKNALVPRIKKLCLGTNSLSVRVNSLLCLGKLLEFMDKWYVLDEILPILQKVQSREPSVLMSILGILKVTMSHPKLGFTKDVLANRVLPFIFPLCIDSNLNLHQFSAYMSVVKEMVGKVESEHRTKLEQLDSMQQEQRTLQFDKESVENSGRLVPGISEKKTETMMDQFLSGFGGMFNGSVGVRQQTPAATAGSNTSYGGTSTSTVRQDTSLPNKPAKVSLSLEEKRRLAQQQEAQQRLKSQDALQPTAAPVAPCSQTRDLTSTLLATDTRSQTNLTPMSGFGGGRGSSSVTGATSTFSQPSGGQTHSNFGASTGWRQVAPPAGNQPMKMSALDNLLPTIGSNQGTQVAAPQAGGMFGGQPQGMMGQGMPGMMGDIGRMGNTGVMANSNMVRNSNNMMGNSSMMGNSGMMGNTGMMGKSGMMGNSGIMGNSGMMGNSGIMGNSSVIGKTRMMGNANMLDGMGQSFSSTPMTQQTPQSAAKPLSAKDIDDFLG